MATRAHKKLGVKSGAQEGQNTILKCLLSHWWAFFIEFKKKKWTFTQKYGSANISCIVSLFKDKVYSVK